MVPEVLLFLGCKSPSLVRTSLERVARGDAVMLLDPVEELFHPATLSEGDVEVIATSDGVHSPGRPHPEQVDRLLERRGCCRVADERPTVVGVVDVEESPGDDLLGADELKLVVQALDGLAVELALQLQPTCLVRDMDASGDAGKSLLFAHHGDGEGESLGFGGGEGVHGCCDTGVAAHRI